MARKEEKYAAFAWADLQVVIAEWSADYQCSVVVELHNSIHGASHGYVEVKLYELGAQSGAKELVRTRGPFSWAARSGQPGAVAYQVFCAFQELDNNPWLWTAGYRHKRARPGS